MARIYSKAFLVAARSLISLEPLDGALWRCLVDNRISNRLPTRRGCRAGRRKLRLTEHDLASPNLLSRLPPLNNVLCSSIEVDVSTQQNLHIGTLNIQNDTFAFRSTGSFHQIVGDHARDAGPQEPSVTPPRKNFYVPKIMVSNTMSLAPKIVEMEEFVARNKVSLAFITETWLKSTVMDSVVDIPGYSIIRKDRSSEEHGGVCLYIKDGCFKYKQLNDISCCADHEVLWVQLTPSRLPRGFSSIVAAVVYHPHWTLPENNSMRDHLFQSLALVESKYPNSALIVAGDFNRLDITSIKKHFRLKQIVKKPTRKNAILDLVLTNLHQFYDDPCTFPPFGLSDHHTVTVAPRIRDKSQSASKFVLKRDKRASRKAELGRYLDAIDWLTLFSSAESCEDLLDVFMNFIRTGLDLIMPVKRVRINTTDAPWMTQHLKSLIRKRQKAFHQHGSDSVQFKFFRNAVNRGRKACEASFYKSKVENMKEENPGVWWKEVKRLAGVQSSPGNVISQIQVEGVENISEKELADLINWAFLEPLEEYRLDLPLSKLPVEEDSLFLEVSEARMQSLLANLNPSKASGPDSIPNWLLKEYADFLCRPLTVIFNASFKEQCLPQIWKMADVTPLPKTKPVKELKKDLRPISLTACLSKVAEECVVVDYVKPAALRVLDPNQYGAVPNSSTTQALIHMVHHWSKETDGNGATVRTVLFDYRKAFDLIDHNILVHKLTKLDLPNSVINWIIDFLSDRLQRIKLADGCYSEWGSVPSGVPQGTKLGPWLFLILINDLNLATPCSDHNAPRIWKYVDDTTASEVVIKGRESKAQQIADQVVHWSSENKMKLNSDKCKELRISFARNQTEFSPVIVNGKGLEVVQHAKLLGLTISSDLSWNEHISNVVKKASKRLYFFGSAKACKGSL